MLLNNSLTIESGQFQICKKLLAEIVDFTGKETFATKESLCDKKKIIQVFLAS